MDETHAQWPRFDGIDLGVLLIAGGHVISTLAVFQLDGDRRAALNLTFEWIGLLIAWRIFRSLFQDQKITAQGIAVVIAVCVGLSCFGIWQHHVFYAEQSDWYRSLRTELDQRWRVENRRTSYASMKSLNSFRKTKSQCTVPRESLGKIAS